ncbi:MAG: cysteine--tRNA ligase [Candidatus Nanopelagicaceae bacterium]|nr:cysteine--tRNA ligase [Candidatus Nanopelagicaceae bacterium]
MPLSMYDTKSRELRPIVPETDPIRMYCCGPTVYRDAHVGNLRTFLLSDLIKRTLQLLGHQVVLIQNITDVGHMSEDLHAEDKVIAQSKVEKIDPFEIARKYEAAFHTDLARLNILPAEMYPRASECIAMMQELISGLLERHYAYVGTDGSVYFDAASFPEYGQLSGNRLDSLQPGYRYEYSDEGGKRFHADWALWKLAGHRTEMVWNSPWGVGFPGWHVECSAMSIHYLHGHVDVHVGGIDLRFPHHENERAQSNAITGREVVDLWVHGEHLLFQGRKMSKSAGNVLLLNHVIEEGYDPLAVRLVLLENRYRSQMDLTWDSIAAAHKTLRRWRNLIGQLPLAAQVVNEDILKALIDDLDTPQAIQVIRALEKDSKLPLEFRIGSMLYADQVLGLNLTKKETRVLTIELEELLEQRLNARKQKDWTQSDLLRDALESKGLIIEDSPTGQDWRWR